MRPIGRPIEPASTPALPKGAPNGSEAPEARSNPVEKIAEGLNDALGIAQNAGKHGADTLDSRDLGSSEAKSYSSDPLNAAFRKGLKRIKLTAARFAELSGAAPKTVEGWLQGIARPSAPAMTILDLIEHCVPARERLEAQHPRQPRSKPLPKDSAK
jgi:DNA-binding transcriptional regulator YiaG